MMKFETTLNWLKERRALAVRSIPLIAAAGLVGAIILAVRLTNELGRSFPQLQSGRYIGFVDGSVVNDQSTDVGLYAELAGPDRVLKLFLFRPGFPLKLAGASDLGAQTSVPLLLSGDSGILRFTGIPSKEGRGYEGQVENITTGRSGVWTLNPIDGPIVGEEPAEVNQTMTALHLFRELSSLNIKNEDLDSQLQPLIDERQRLTQLIEQGEELKTRASSKFEQQLSGLEQEKARYFAVGKQVKKLEDNLLVARSVSDSGRLTALARQSLEREWRWMYTH